MNTNIDVIDINADINKIHTSFTPKRFIDAIRYYAKKKGEQTACIFQTLNVDSAERLSYNELNVKLTQRAQLLLSRGYQHQRVALLYPAGLDFVVNFLACLAAGVTAIPLSLSRNAKQVEHILHILDNANVKVILTTQETRNTLLRQLSELPYPQNSQVRSLVWLDEFDQGTTEFCLPKVNPKDLALIQYTSGSTSLPKGVMVSHHNIVDNQRAIQKACGHQEGLIAGGWLPQFHDMGLIGQMLQPLYLGGIFVSMPAMTFIQRPRRWLELISQYRIQSSPAPNFGYEHCIKFIAEREDLSHIDLSCWKVALNGSEPISAEVMSTFSEKFKPYGFDATAFFPCYGMAETTLFVSGGPRKSGMSTLVLDKKTFEKGKIQKVQHVINGHNENQHVVNCGLISSHFDVKIVNPQTSKKSTAEEIGEIWISGESVALGYWNNEEQTQKYFRATLSPDNSKQYLRTGDMGFIRDHHLYVTGRIKEMLIIRGRNLYPYDIERTCNAYQHAAGHNGSAVFAFTEGNNTGLAGIIEIKKRALNNHDHEVIKSDLRAAIMEQHNITLNTLLLVKPGRIPKTTSGKVKRIACQAFFNKQRTALIS